MARGGGVYEELDVSMCVAVIVCVCEYVRILKSYRYSKLALSIHTAAW